MQNIFNKLYNSKYLNQEESYQLFKSVSSGKIKDIKLASILTAMKIRGESKEEIMGAILAFSEHVKHFPRPDYMFSDIVGTGGDINKSINISTASAFVASSFGLKIVKHCNKGISSKSGSSDLLKKFNINLHASSEKSRKSLDMLNICFLFAPEYHKSFKCSENVRKILNTRTIFNLLGPFLNPAKPRFTIIGVCDKQLINPVIKILHNLKYKRGIVINGNKTDEVTLDGTTYVSELFEEKIFSYKLQSKDFGLKSHGKNSIKQYSLEENYSIIKKIMQGKGDVFYEELIAVNVAILLKIFGFENLKDNTQLALEKIRSGEVYKHIVNIANFLKEDEDARNNT